MNELWNKESATDFNTSHVTVYRSAEENKAHYRTISIHPMLLFIKLPFESQILTFKFQYIPCYCLSVAICTKVNLIYGFQYIPCYCLSLCYYVWKILQLIFQYIPCYCLSNEFNPFLLQAPSSFPLFYAISTFFTSRL